VLLLLLSLSLFALVSYFVLLIIVIQLFGYSAASVQHNTQCQCHIWSAACVNQTHHHGSTTDKLVTDRQ